MSTDIVRDATLILSALASAPRNEYVAAPNLANETNLSPDRVNDAVALLVDGGLVEWIQVMGTAPFDFGDAIITPRGRRELQRAPTAPPNEELNQSPPTAGKTLQLFVSHATGDVELARRLVVLLATALNLPAAAIRCTSVNGYRLPAGANTNEQLRREVHESTAFIGIVSQSSLLSMFVMFELGARWGAGKNLIPLVAKGLPMSALREPLAGLNALRADDRGQLQQLIHDVGMQLGIGPQSPAVFDRAMQDVLDTPASNILSTVAVAERGELSKEAESVLVALADLDGATPEDLASQLQVSETKVQYCLDLLEEKELVASIGYSGRSSEYSLERAGRKYVIERRLVS